MKKIIAVIFGGPSSEHEVSHVSANSIIDNLDQKKYQIIPIFWTKNNDWQELPPTKSFQSEKPGKTLPYSVSLTSLSHILTKYKIDLVFPVLHGPYGEDGVIQGLLEMLKLPYVGCGVTGSAVCMDKVIQKNICRDYGIPVTQFFWLSLAHWTTKKEQTLELIRQQFDSKYPLFVKPVNQGSSIGITKAHNEKELIEGIETALTRDLKVIIEVGIKEAREIECAVLGTNSQPECSVLGEIKPSNEFYDFEAKYLDGKSKTTIPAKLDTELERKITHTARLAFEALDCYGLARIDFLVDQDGKFYLDELNTMPGFTEISMYSKLWKATGLAYPKLLDKLIELALRRDKNKKLINYSR